MSLMDQLRKFAGVAGEEESEDTGYEPIDIAKEDADEPKPIFAKKIKTI